LLGEKLRNLFRPASAPAGNGNGHPGAGLPPTARPARAPQLPPVDRTSNGLRQFFDNLQGGPDRLRVLDIGGASQANVDFIALRGHKLYTEDFLMTLDRLAAGGRATAEETALQEFLAESLHYPAEHFDGILVWDTLEFLGDDLLAAAVARLEAILKPGGTLLAFFHTSAKGETVPVYRYEIRDPQHGLHLEPRCLRNLPRSFNNRNIERLFRNFRSVKFFLAKDGLREVIVIR
jgi:hypothetical protein